MNESSHRKQLRSFGLLVGGVFLFIGLWPLIWRGGDPRIWAVGIGATLAVLGSLVPESLESIHRGWMAVGHALGWINTRVILGVFFYVVLTPIGITMRLLGKDPLRLKPAPDAESYRVNREPRPSSHFRHQF
jgi:hypothetical protein